MGNGKDTDTRSRRKGGTDGGQGLKVRGMSIWTGIGIIHIRISDDLDSTAHNVSIDLQVSGTPNPPQY